MQIHYAPSKRQLRPWSAGALVMYQLIITLIRGQGVPRELSLATQTVSPWLPGVGSAVIKCLYRIPDPSKIKST